MNTEQREELRRLAKAATPGPWVFGYWTGQCHVAAHAGGHPGSPQCKYDPEFVASDFHNIANPNKPNAEITGNYDYEVGGVIHEPDAALIVAAVNALPALLDALDAGPRSEEGLRDELLAWVRKQRAKPWAESGSFASHLTGEQGYDAALEELEARLNG